jgi:tRNA 2-thiocytidine biosynthesis protein TtcA
MEKYQEVEKSIITTYRGKIWRKFTSAVNEYKLINSGDKIAVCISGGKDSMLLAKCVQELHRHGVQNFEAVFLVMDPGYSPENRALIESNARLLNVPIQIFETEIYNIAAAAGGSPCYLCARMRRGHLYAKARELGCNKIALAHHFNDVIETVLMGIFYNGQIKSMMPKLHSTNFSGMELIRPLYQVKEADIIIWRNKNGLKFIQCACRFTEHCTAESGGDGKRYKMKQLVKSLLEDNPNADINIFRSMYNVNLRNIIGYKKDGYVYNFLDDYDSFENGGEEE